MSFSYSGLKTEINTDPAALGYATHVTSGNDGAIAAILNDLALGGTKGYTLEVGFATVNALQETVVTAEYVALTQALRDLWQAILTAASRESVPIKNANLRAQALAIWAAGTTTRANIAALQSRTCTRAEFIFGEGVAPSPSDVAIALRFT